MKDVMLFRFSLYGFLKNQQYYDPFLLLAFMEKGLSLGQIGLLIGFREICINFMEIPTGAIADVVGRRRSMIFSFLAYIGSFLIFGLTARLELLFVGMFLFSIGEAFRTGTHKAMIFTWLSRNDRTHEKTKVYGYTRSWSKIGSAVSAVIAAGLVFATGRFSNIFLFCIAPYVLNLINFMGYPKYLDGAKSKHTGLGGIARALYQAFRDSIRNRNLRRLFAESMCFEGSYKVCKDYLQPAVVALALAVPLMTDFDVTRRTAVLAAPIYLVLYLLASWASRRSHKIADLAGSQERGTLWIWWMYLAMFVVIAGASGFKFAAAAIPAFMLLALLQNFWRPMLVSRFADHAHPDRQATVLSIESQGKSLFAAALAPILGYAVDFMSADTSGEINLLPVGLAGVAIAGAVLLFRMFASSGDSRNNAGVK